MILHIYSDSEKCFHISAGASFISSRLISVFASADSLLKILDKIVWRTSDVTNWNSIGAKCLISNVLFWYLGGCTLCKPASLHECTSRKCIWHANSVITLLVRALLFNWCENANTIKSISYVVEDSTHMLAEMRHCFVLVFCKSHI